MNDEYGTPSSFFRPLDDFFHFTLDPCANEENTLAIALYYTKQDDGLSKYWHGHNVFMNPPYSLGNINKFLAKTIAEACASTFIAALIRNDRSTTWWHELVQPHAWAVWDIPFRIRFVGADGPYPFPSAHCRNCSGDMTLYFDLSSRICLMKAPALTK